MPAARDRGRASEVDPRVLRAAERVLRRDGWDALSIERVSEEAGISRVTLWRQGLTRERVLEALLRELAVDYRDAMWPVLTSSESGRSRLATALGVLCDVAERHLALLQVSDAVFHQARSAFGPQASFVEPIERIVHDGIRDGSLDRRPDPQELAEVLFNGVCWPYVHLRGRHGWSPEHARSSIVALVMPGAGASSPAERRAPPKRVRRAR